MHGWHRLQVNSKLHIAICLKNVGYIGLQM